MAGPFSQETVRLASLSADMDRVSKENSALLQELAKLKASQAAASCTSPSTIQTPATVVVVKGESSRPEVGGMVNGWWLAGTTSGIRLDPLIPACAVTLVLGVRIALDVTDRGWKLLGCSTKCRERAITLGVLPPCWIKRLRTVWGVHPVTGQCTNHASL